MVVPQLLWRSLALAGFAFAMPQAHAEWSAQAQVVYLSVYGTGFKFGLQGTLTGCSDASGTQFYVDWKFPASKQIYALVLSAYQSGDQLTANYECEAASGSGLAYTQGVDVRR